MARPRRALLHPPRPPAPAAFLCHLSRVRRRAGSLARCGQSTPPSKSSSDLYASDSPSEIKPIYRRAASTTAGQVQRYLLLSARAEPPKVFTHGAGGSPWFLPVDGSGAPDGIDVSPQEWVDEWCACQRSPPGVMRSADSLERPRGSWQAERSSLRGGGERVRPARLPRPWCEPGVSGGNVWCRIRGGFTVPVTCMHLRGLEGIVMNHSLSIHSGVVQ